MNKHDLGDVLGNDTRFWLLRNPDTVRGPDLAFLSKATLASIPPEDPWFGSPDLAIEVRSNGDRPGEAQRKIGQYLDGGSQLVWLVDPERRQVGGDRFSDRPLAQLPRHP